VESHIASALFPLLDLNLYEAALACCGDTAATLADVAGDLRLKKHLCSHVLVVDREIPLSPFPSVPSLRVLRSLSRPVTSVVGLGTTPDEAAAATRRLEPAGALPCVPPLPPPRRKLRIGLMSAPRNASSSLDVAVATACAWSLPAEVVAAVGGRPYTSLPGQTHLDRLMRLIPATGLSKEEFEAECTSVLLEAQAEVVVLIGYTRILSKNFLHFWGDRMLEMGSIPGQTPSRSSSLDKVKLEEGEIGCVVVQEAGAKKITAKKKQNAPLPIVVRKTLLHHEATVESLPHQMQALEGQAFVAAIELYIQKWDALLARASRRSAAPAAATLSLPPAAHHRPAGLPSHLPPSFGGSIVPHPSLDASGGGYRISRDAWERDEPLVRFRTDPATRHEHVPVLLCNLVRSGAVLRKRRRVTSEDEDDAGPRKNEKRTEESRARRWCILCTRTVRDACTNKLGKSSRRPGGIPKRPSTACVKCKVSLCVKLPSKRRKGAKNGNLGEEEEEDKNTDTRTCFERWHEDVALP